MTENQNLIRSGNIEWMGLGLSMDRCHGHLLSAKSPEEFQAVGVTCRECISTLAQIVWHEDHHPILDPPANGKSVSQTDAKRKLDAYFAAELKGESNVHFRGFAKSANDLANGVTHRRTANFADAARCFESVVCLVNFVAICEGRCSQNRPWEIGRMSVSADQLLEAALAYQEGISEKVSVPGAKWPVPIAQGPLLMIQVFPAFALSNGASIDHAKMMRVHPAFKPAAYNRLDSRTTIEDWLMWSPRNDDDTAYDYHLADWLSLVSNNGVTVIFSSLDFAEDDEGSPTYIGGFELKSEIEETLKQVADGYRELGISSPGIVSVSLWRVQGLRLNRSRPHDTKGFDRWLVVLPYVRLADVTAIEKDELFPVFDALWRAAGWPEGAPR